MAEEEAGIEAVARRLAAPRLWYDRFRYDPRDGYDRYLDAVVSAVVAGWQESPAALGQILDVLEEFVAYRPGTGLLGDAQAYWRSAQELATGLVLAFRRWLAAPPDAAAVSTASEAQLLAAMGQAHAHAVAYEQSGTPAELAAARSTFEQAGALIIAGAPLGDALQHAPPDRDGGRVRSWLTGLLAVVSAVPRRPSI